MIVNSYDTDNLTDRQNHYFNKLRGMKNGLAASFIRHCVNENYSRNQFNNYEGDCDWLKHVKPNLLEKCGIDLEKLYT